MLQRLVDVDNLPLAGAACVAAAASVLDVAQQWAIALLGVSLGVPLAAFAGTLYGLSFRAPLSPLHLWVNLVGGTMLASVVSPLAGNTLGLNVAFMAGVSAVLGFLLQFAQPWLLSRRDSLLDRGAGRVLGAAQPPTDTPPNNKGGQS